MYGQVIRGQMQNLLKLRKKTSREQNVDLNIHFPEVDFIRG